ncbi:hypothetical protein GCM10009836_60720 [Pseudonocardia ailaonensis]|uniref:Acetoacetate decarboxylase n=1 Tax=Pseudonocardia ailaonensis TaxID=367279 RepID=A0ABN2NJJ2_9PSEU
MDIENYGLKIGSGETLYGRPPWYLTDADSLVAYYEAETESVARLLPPELEPASDPVRCFAWYVEYGESSLGGGYREVLMYVGVRFEGAEYMYAPLVYVDTDSPMAMGREVWGIPKKIADFQVQMQGSGGAAMTMSRPRLRPLITMTFVPEAPCSPDDVPAAERISFRGIPGHSGSPDMSVSEFLRLENEISFRTISDGRPDAWSGQCEVSMLATSSTDPLHLLAPKRMLAGFRLKYDVTLLGAKLLKTVQHSDVDSAVRS